MSNNGWVKLHRNLLDWEWWDDHNTTRLFIYLLLKSNHDNKDWHGITIKTGQVLTGRQKLSRETGLSERSIRTSLKHLKATSEIAIKTTNQYSIITICKWKEYQSKETSENDYKVTSDRPASDQQVTTNKNYKNYKNINTSINTRENPASFGNEFINLILKQFEGIYGHQPIDKKPRNEAYNLYRSIKKAANNDDTRVEKGINLFFEWVSNQESLEKVKNLNVVRRNLPVFLTEIKGNNHA